MRKSSWCGYSLYCIYYVMYSYENNKASPSFFLQFFTKFLHFISVYSFHPFFLAFCFLWNCGTGNVKFFALDLILRILAMPTFDKRFFWNTIIMYLEIWKTFSVICQFYFLLTFFYSYFIILNDLDAKKYMWLQTIITYLTTWKYQYLILKKIWIKLIHRHVNSELKFKIQQI